MVKMYQMNLTLFLLTLVVTIPVVKVLLPVDAERYNVNRLHVAGLILARCGSKGIPFKNLAKIGTESLLNRTIKTLQVSRRLSSIWVATDCNIIAHEALLSGALVFRRSPQSATDKAPSILAIKEFLDFNPGVDVVALFQCTSPFLALPFIHSAVSLIHEGYNSVFSVTRQFKLRWNINSAGDASASNFDPSHRPRRQDWNGELVENGMFYMMSRHLVADGLLQGGRIGVVEVPGNCSLEIDTQADLDVAVSNMATDLANGTIPSFYRDVYDLCSVAESVSKEMFTRLLVKSGLPQQKLSQIWELMDAKQGSLSRTSLYKALALVAWAQQGKELSVKLLDNFSGDEYPVPSLGDLSDLRQLQKQRQRQCHPGHLGMRYGDLCRLDTVTVHLVPEKKGLFLKHVEYQVTSKRFSTKVRRRYNDFVSLYDLLLGRFPYRMIPRLPPKKMNIGSDTQFIEERRQWLWRWLCLVSRHPVINQDPTLQFFFTYDGDDVQHKIREIFRRVPDEFTTSEHASMAKELVPPDTLTELANSREHIRLITNSVSRVKQITDGLAQRSQAYGTDMAELGTQLTLLASENNGTSSWATGGNQIWSEMKKGFNIISKELGILSSKAMAQSVREEAELCAQLNLLMDILFAYRDLCARHEKGVMQDHQKAHAKMLSLKKRQMQGVLRGEVESVVALEDRMLQQESVIASVELRSAYSLHCMHMETQLVHAHLELFATVISVLVSVQIRGHSELAEVWRAIQPSISKCLPEDAA